MTNWIALAREHVPFQGLPARIAWLGHGDRTALAVAVNDMVRDGKLAAPIAFTRDHLDAGAMTHPNIMTENLMDGSDAISDWPLLNAMMHCSSMADLVAIHSGGGGYSGYMTSAGVTVVADGTDTAPPTPNLTQNQRHVPGHHALCRRRLPRTPSTRPAAPTSATSRSNAVGAQLPARSA